MKKFFLIFLSFLSIIIFTSCGKRAYVDYKPQNIPVVKNSGCSNVLILPFGSYTLSKSPAMWMKINQLLFDSFADNFAQHKIMPVPFDDVFTLLKSKGFINFNRETNISPSLKIEYENTQWSPEMRKEIAKIIFEEKRQQIHNKKFNPVLFLTRNNLFDINNYFKADYILKGTITELSIKKEETFNPLKIGFINAPLRVISRALYGPPESSGWSTGQEVFTGIITGGILGSFANEPFQAPGYKTTKVPILGTTIRERESGPTDYEWGNAAFWGAMTGFTAFIASHGANIPEIVVGLRLYFYSGKTGQLLWTNRVKLHVTPESQWSKQDVGELVDFAIKKSVNTIMKSFWESNIEKKIAKN